MTMRPYRPSNGTEGIVFDNAWCANCQHDAAWREDDHAEPCDILSRTFVYSIDDADYPTEWVEDDVPYPAPTNPRCTAFTAIGGEGSSYVADERQIEMPL